MDLGSCDLQTVCSQNFLRHALWVATLSLRQHCYTAACTRSSTLTASLEQLHIRNLPVDVGRLIACVLSSIRHAMTFCGLRFACPMLRCMQGLLVRRPARQWRTILQVAGHCLKGISQSFKHGISDNFRGPHVDFPRHYLHISRCLLPVMGWCNTTSSYNRFDAMRRCRPLAEDASSSRICIHLRFVGSSGRVAACCFVD